jgi:hypothetical protein
MHLACFFRKNFKFSKIIKACRSKESATSDVHKLIDEKLQAAATQQRTNFADVNYHDLKYKISICPDNRKVVMILFSLSAFSQQPL